MYPASKGSCRPHQTQTRDTATLTMLASCSFLLPVQYSPPPPYALGSPFSSPSPFIHFLVAASSMAKNTHLADDVDRNASTRCGQCVLRRCLTAMASQRREGGAKCRQRSGCRLNVGAQLLAISRADTRQLFFVGSLSGCKAALCMALPLCVRAEFSSLLPFQFSASSLVPYSCFRPRNFSAKGDFGEAVLNGAGFYAYYCLPPSSVPSLNNGAKVATRCAALI